MPARVLTAAAIALALACAATPARSLAADPAPIDCVGSAGDPAAGTPEWFAREAREARCGEQRATDTASTPLFAAVGAQNLARDGGAVYEGDPFRDPLVLGGSRSRYQTTSFKDPEGQQLDARLFLPCDATCHDMPAGLRRFSPPYPAVGVVHGGRAKQEMDWWGAEPLAEAGYMVLSFQVPTAENTGPTVFPADTKAALNFLDSSAHPRRAATTAALASLTPSATPRRPDHDRRRLGLPGHPAGGSALSQVGQEDPRVS